MGDGYYSADRDAVIIEDTGEELVSNDGDGRSGMQIVMDLHNDGYSLKEISDYLEDEEVLSKTKLNQEQVEDAYSVVRKKLAASALGSSRSEKKVSAARENGRKGGRPSLKKIKETLNVRLERQGHMNGVLRYKVWRYSKSDNAYVFDGSYSYKELREEAGI